MVEKRNHIVFNLHVLHKKYYMACSTDLMNRNLCSTKDVVIQL